MYIAVKSEIDSRVLIYPLLRALKSFGSIVVISTNKQLQRLIDSEEEGGFRNIRVIVDDSGATDEIFAEYGIVEGDYDFVILDNFGATEYDACFVPLGLRHSESFDEDLLNLIESDYDKVKLVQFGKAPRAVKSKEEVLAERKGIEMVNPLDNYDPASKFKNKKAEVKERKNSKAITVPFPSYQDIEDVEAEHKFYAVSPMLIDIIYEAVKNEIHIDKLKFQREVQKKDESSGYIKSRNSTRA